MRLEIRRRRRARVAPWLFLTVALASAGGLALGCGTNRLGSILTPSGEILLPAIGSISGRVDFGDGAFPAALVMIARVSDGGCTSSWSTLQIIGTFTAWNETASPLLTQLAPCVWVDTVTVAAGAAEWKFRGNQSWSNPYGSPGTAQDGLAGCAVRGAGGVDENLRATIPASFAGPVACLFEEGRNCTRGDGASGTPYAFHALGAPGSPALLSSTADGRFTFTELVPGRYNVMVRAPGRAPRTIADVEVGATPADLGTISFGSGSTGGVTGTIAFDPPRFPDLANPPWQPVVVRLMQGTFLVARDTTTRTDKTFSFGTLAPGTYKVIADAHIFKADSISDVTVATSVVDAGTLTLLRETAELATSIHVAGDFNGFAISAAWQMTQAPLGIWTLTGPDSIPAGVQNLKFVTDGVFDNPTDYGGDETVTLAVPATDLPTRIVGGVGTALHLDFAAKNKYRFTLDERRQTFSVQLAPAPTSVRVP